jgi:ribosomal protein L1
MFRLAIMASDRGKMDEDKFNMSVRKFLKIVGVTSQREIEHAIQRATEAGRLQGNETLKAKMTLTIDGIALAHVVEGEIELG